MIQLAGLGARMGAGKTMYVSGPGSAAITLRSVRASSVSQGVMASNRTAQPSRHFNHVDTVG